MRTNLRKIAVLSIPLLILAGCASEPTGPLTYAELSVGLDTQCESFQTGDAAEQITVLGDLGTQPEVTLSGSS